MSSSRSKKQTTTQNATYDTRVTDTLNAGVGGDIEDSTVYSGVDGDLLQLSADTNTDITDFSDYELDNSTDNSVIDFSEHDSSTDNSVIDFSEHDDSTDNSVIDFSEYRNDSSTDNSVVDFSEYDDSIDDSTVYREIDGGVHITDGGAFRLVETLLEDQQETLNASNALVGRSVDAVASVKTGDTTSQAANKDLKTLAYLGGGLAASIAAVKVAKHFSGGRT